MSSCCLILIRLDIPPIGAEGLLLWDFAPDGGLDDMPVDFGATVLTTDSQMCDELRGAAACAAAAGVLCALGSIKNFISLLTCARRLLRGCAFKVTRFRRPELRKPGTPNGGSTLAPQGTRKRRNITRLCNLRVSQRHDCISLDHNLVPLLVVVGQPHS